MNDEALFRVISFNLKRDLAFSLDRANRWGTRREIAAKMIRDSGATIIGVQELLPNMREDVTRLLDVDYSILGFGRFSGTRPSSDEHSDIIIKNDCASVKLCKTFWLSNSPEKISRAWFAMFPRICTIAEVRLKRLGRTVRVFNTHLDHVSGLARLLGLKLILSYIERFNEENPMPTVLMGDFNAKYHSRPLQLLHNQMFENQTVRLTDVYEKMSPGEINNTLHYFKGKVKVGASPIDYIFVSDEFEVVSTRIITDSFNGRFPSDHYPLEATLRLREPKAQAV